MPRTGTLVVCVQNLDCSGANQVVLNLLSGKVHESNVVVLSPKNGDFATRFLESGASVRVGVIEDLLLGIRNVFCIVCNTIMTADIVVAMSKRSLPTIWILHEWWSDEMIKQSLELRGYTGLTLDTVKEAMASATKIVCVCQSQKDFYNPAAPTSVIYVGVPDPVSNKPEEAISLECAIDDAVAETGIPRSRSDTSTESYEDCKPFTFLCLGIICPRKNQHWTVQLFKKFARNKPNVRLQVVGARYTRDYEVQYLEKVKAEAGDDPRIEIYDVTSQVDTYYNTADCLILTSLNEVTPMVISEAMSRGIPVLTTNIAGIEEMVTDGVEGFHFKPHDDLNALQSMETIYSNEELRRRMSTAARLRFETTFSQEAMAQSFRDLLIAVAPPVILIDMDGTLVDWDAGFFHQWKNLCHIDRTKSYYMEDCVTNPVYRESVLDLAYSKGFFAGLPWMEGAKAALMEMKEAGFRVRIVTSPLRGSQYCAQEKIDWVRAHLGEEWLDNLIICYDKTTISGDLLIDDKPYDLHWPGWKHTLATWKQVIFDAPYNHEAVLPRLCEWKDWKSIILPMLGRVTPSQLEELSRRPEGFHGRDRSQSTPVPVLSVAKERSSSVGRQPPMKRTIENKVTTTIRQTLQIDFNSDIRTLSLKRSQKSHFKKCRCFLCAAL